MLFSPFKYKNKLLLSLLLMSGVSLPYHAQAAVSDVQINSLISQAIDSHPLVGSAKAEQEATKEGISAAKLNLLPVPSFSTGYQKDKDLVSEINIRQPLWTGGRLTANVNQAIFDDKAAIENIYEQQNDVAKTTIDAWQSYISAVAKQRVYLENLEQLADFEAMMQRRVKQGVSARIELDLVTNRILQEQNAYEAAVEQQSIAGSRLEQIIGHPLSRDSARFVPQLKVLADQAKIQSAGFEQMAFNKASFYNPSVVKEYFQIESAKQQVKSQRASNYPSLYAQYTYTYEHEDNDNGNDNDNDGAFLVGLNYEPGAGFSNLALTRASAARVNSLIQNQEAARRNVMENIQVEYQKFASAKSREQSLVAAVAGAQIVVDSYRRQFIAGRKSWLEVLNAVRELSDYQNQLVQTRSDILGSFYKLQVDFGLMPWQKFARNREKVDLFKVTDPVQNWLGKQDNVLDGQDFEYNNYVTQDQPISSDSLMEVNLPASAEQRLNDGVILRINDDKSVEEVSTIENEPREMSDKAGKPLSIKPKPTDIHEVSDDYIYIEESNQTYQQPLNNDEDNTVKVRAPISLTENFTDNNDHDNVYKVEIYEVDDFFVYADRN